MNAVSVPTWVDFDRGATTDGSGLLAARPGNASMSGVALHIAMRSVRESPDGQTLNRGLGPLHRARVLDHADASGGGRRSAPPVHRTGPTIDTTVVGHHRRHAGIRDAVRSRRRLAHDQTAARTEQQLSNP